MTMIPCNPGIAYWSGPNAGSFRPSGRVQFVSYGTSGLGAEAREAKTHAKPADKIEPLWNDPQWVAEHKQESRDMKDGQKRFMRHVRKTRTCWLWTGTVAKHRGYGSFGFYKNKRRIRHYAHKAAWVLFRGGVPTGLNVLHKCDVRLCVRPSHLFLGTQADNIRDAVAKGRHVRGETHGCAKLTWRRIREIRRLAAQGMLHVTLAERFNVTPTNIGYIVRKRTWV